MKKTIYITGLIALPLLFGASVYAQSVPATTDNSALSDYAKDVQEGEKQLASDVTVRNQSIEVKKTETVEASVDHSQSSVDKVVEHDENEVGDSRTADGVKTESEVEHETETKTQTSDGSSTDSHESTEKSEVKD